MHGARNWDYDREAEPPELGERRCMPRSLEALTVGSALLVVATAVGYCLGCIASDPGENYALQGTGIGAAIETAHAALVGCYHLIRRF
jgi:hypothetical protein